MSNINIHYSYVLLLIFMLISLSSSQAQKQLRIGLLFVKDIATYEVSMGYRTSASAVLIARDRIKAEHLLDGYDIDFIYDFDDCNEVAGAGKTVDMILNKSVDAIFGPTCNRPGLAASAIASYYNIPIFEWGLTTSKELTDRTRFSTTVPFSINSFSLAMSIRGVLKQFDWDEFVFVYSNDGDDEKCDSLKDDIQTVVAMHDDITIAYTYQITKITIPNMREAIKAIKTRGRVIIICVPSGNGAKKAIMAAAMLEDANTSEYVYIMAETNSRGFIVEETGGGQHYLWDGNGSVSLGIGLTNQESRVSFTNLLFLVDNMGMNEEITPQYLNFSKEVINRMKDAPFYCVDDCASHDYSSVAKYAGQLSDAVYAYAVALNRSLIENPNADIRNGTMILDNMGMTFEGVGGGDVIVDPDSARRSIIYLIGLNSSLLPQTYARLEVNNVTTIFEPYYDDESELFNGPKPDVTPICGFSGNSCPVDFIHDYLIYVIIIALLIAIAIASAVVGVIFAIRTKKLELERQDMLWQIGHIELHPIARKSIEASQHSFASGPSTSTKITVESRAETSRFLFLILKNEVIAANKHDMKVQLTIEEKTELRKMRTLDNDNLNKFIGLCQDGPQLLSIWRYCSRGSLSDVISKSSMQMDSFFIFSLIRDISNGISFIHSSFMRYHGNLTSRCCLIDDRWQIKISDYGLYPIRINDKTSARDMLWRAPEILRSGDSERTKECDIYSFAIICSEIITRTTAFDHINRKEKAEELLYMIKKGGHNPCRPSLELNETIDVNPALIHLVRDCWTERPSERPTIEQIKSLLRGMNDGRKGNLMDHVFNMLETYASTLEDEVTERTKELVEEKKKSDVLLYRMLPRTVAERLKAGQSVEPETFDMVTIFFSDVVQFTTLASKCSPLQVVQLLNDLYTIFDSIIEQHDVYKVETIGDGYLCVSGLPHRNGNEHCRHIARMALGFLSSLQFFRIPHLPAERINLRIGINCGSVVAGVVGLTMPRFCLFGDAVNTASRMESNGKPGHIHISSEANHLLTVVVGGFHTEPRGEVIIKGKGVMETYWLFGEKSVNTEPVQSIMKDVIRDNSAARSITPINDTPTGIYTEYKSNIKK